MAENTHMTDDLMSIVLLKDHEDATGAYKAGERIRVTPEVHAWLTSVYLAEREAQVAEDAAVVSKAEATMARLAKLKGGAK